MGNRFRLIVRYTMTKSSMFNKLLVIVLLFVTSFLFSQESRLADVYFNDGEYEKAATLYKSLFEKNRQIGLYFQRYTESLLNLKEYAEAEAAIKKELKTNPDDPMMKISLGNVYDRMGNEAEAKKIYDDVINDIGKNRTTSMSLREASPG